MKTEYNIKYLAATLALALFFLSSVVLLEKKQSIFSFYLKYQAASIESAFLPEKDSQNNVLYKGEVRHIFFHSLVVYPELAFNGNPKSSVYRDYMVTKEEFKKILQELYKDNYVLIDIKSLYSVDKDGFVTKNALYIPEGKKPLIISLDDLSYYSSMTGHGFADKLLIDKDGKVATEVVTPEGKSEITRDGDVVPLLDDFVALHPDFSFKGAKGVIALTGYEGILGYRTDPDDLVTRPNDLSAAIAVISKLKSTGWRFASHSYTHGDGFLSGYISLSELKSDTEFWDREVKPLVGSTDIFIGPFGQIFSPGDPRIEYLVEHGFKMLCGVGMDKYFNFFGNYVVMNRGDIDGYRMLNNPELLKDYFNPNSVIDPSRKPVL